MKDESKFLPDRLKQSRRNFIRNSALAGGAVTLFPWAVNPREDMDQSEVAGNVPGIKNIEDRLLEMGLLDVTKSPYLADPKGKKDSTQAIQAAVNDARDKGLVCFFPGGTYIISDMISCEQKIVRRDTPYTNNVGTRHYDAIRRPMVLMGSTRGKRPVIKLSESAKGFDDPANPKKAVWIWAQEWFDAPGKDEPEWGKEQGNINFNHFFMNIDIDIRGHAGAIGIRHSGSQGSSLLNSTIYAEGAYCGMNNCCGQGGGTYNIEVIGGEHGIILDSDSRFPVLISCAFSGQAKSAVAYSGINIQVPTMMVGCFFKTGSKSVADMTNISEHAGLLLIDCMCEGESGTEMLMTKKPENLFIENTYVKGFERIFINGSTLTNGNKWSLIEKCSTQSGQGMNLINGQLSADEIINYKLALSAPSRQEILGKHYKGVPSFEDNDAVNVKDFGAAGDGKKDDTEAFRKAIGAAGKIFVPKGNYVVYGSLPLKNDTIIFGLTSSFSSIGPSGSFPERGVSLSTERSQIIEEEAFKLVTVDDRNAAPGLFMLSVRGNTDWKSGKGIWFLVSGRPYITSGGGGKFYGTGAMGIPFILEGIKNPTAFYALNVERVRSNPQSEIRNCSHVSIYYFKVEAGTLESGIPTHMVDANTPCTISNSDDIKIYCMYGAVYKLVNRPMLGVVDSKRIEVCQLKSFRTGDYPHIRETIKGSTFEIPSTKLASYFIRD